MHVLALELGCVEPNACPPLRSRHLRQRPWSLPAVTGKDGVTIPVDCILLKAEIIS